MSIKVRAAQGDEAIAPPKRARVRTDPHYYPIGVAANQPRFTKIGQLI
ncbi:MAG TPA: hypothetical protein VL171_18620 [Verrucomicrobiae bacterium]|nr:hypothetical protein [Verrucomicrobiae bacterium]